MPIAVSLWFDEQLEAALRARWAELAARGLSTFDAGPIRPHVTIGIWDGLEESRLVDALRELVRAREPFEIGFESVALFPGDEGVVFLSPRPSEALLGVHRDVHALARRLGGTPHPLVAPGAWVPHCTMASRGPREQALRACDLLLDSGLPLAGRVTSLGVIDTPAEIERHRIALSAEARTGSAGA